MQVLAIVDSGAYRTSFPLQIATDLGISDDELNEDPDGGGGVGVGSRFRVWTTDVPIMGGSRSPNLEGTGSPSRGVRDSR